MNAAKGTTDAGNGAQRTETVPPSTDAVGGVDSTDGAASPTKPRRRLRPFPALPFEEALVLGQAIQQHAAGQEVRRLTLFDHMNREPDSAASRLLITSSNQYGVTTGSYKAETLSLTPDGATATSDQAAPKLQLEARFKLAIAGNKNFKNLYDNYRDSRLPAAAIMEDKAKELGVDPEFARECVETFVVNAKFLGLLRPVAGADRLLSIEHVLEDYLPGRGERAEESPDTRESIRQAPAAAAPMGSVVDAAFDTACFYVTPIGTDESEQRMHSDLFMGSLVEPALAEFGLALVRADQIGRAGLITSQIIEYLVRAKLVIADLSFNNPNVFYEMAIRHAVRKPIVQIIRKCDRIPFDVNQMRTVVIDTDSIYTLVPRLDTYRAEIASQIRLALDASSNDENPLTAFYPAFWQALPRPAG